MPGTSHITSGILHTSGILLLSFIFLFSCKKDHEVVPSPAITSFSPTSGPTGATVIITGANFSSTPTENTVMFNSAAAAVSAATASQLTVTVPAGAITGKITVATRGTATTSAADFTIPCSTGTIPEKVVCLANAFLETLTDEQRTGVVLPLTLVNAKRWSYLACGSSCRNGLEFSGLTAAQLVAAQAVIQAASGTSANEGYSEYLQIRAADDVLAQVGGVAYSSNRYIIAFLGAPTLTGTWILQFGGHHYAQNITYTNGVVTSVTPSHQGIEPKTWTTGGVTFAPLATEQSVMAIMLASFTTAELASAKIATAFSDVRMIPGSTSNTMPATKEGIKVSALSAAAQAKVLAAMVPWLEDLDATAQARFTALYTSELADTYVTYSGNAAGTSGNAASFLIASQDYVRIDGPSVWIEFICQPTVVTSGGIRYHSVFCDHVRDYIGL